MTRVWFNKTFSLIHVAMKLVRMGDVERRYTLIHSSSNPVAVGKLACDIWNVEPPDKTGTEYLKWCLSFCNDAAIGIFVPGKEASLIAAHVDAFRTVGTRVMTAASPEILSLLYDKASFSESIKEMEIPAVEFARFNDIGSFEDAYADMRKRYSALCVKPSQSVYGIGFKRIVEDRSALDVILSGDPYRIDLVSFKRALEEGELSKTMLLMPYLEGPEFSVDCVALDGQMLCAVARRKSTLSGEGQLIDPREDIQDSCMRLIERFKLNGNINIQYRNGPDGLRVLEINPRMSGGIGMASQAGINLPYLALRAFDQGKAQLHIPPPQYDLIVGEVNTPVCLS